MSRVSNKFINPATTYEYDWILNHSEEEEGGLSRTIEHTAPTSGLGLIRQQGEEQPFEIKLVGTILDDDQLEEFRAWYQLSRFQTFYYRSFAGDEYEVLMTALRPTRQRVVRAPKTGATYIWKYNMTLEVVAVRAGPWLTVSL